MQKGETSNESYELRPNPGPEQVPGGDDWAFVLPAIAVAVCIVALLLYRRLRRRAKQASTPEEMAIAELTSLQKWRPQTAEEADRWIVRFSEVLRRYLNDRFQCRPPKGTTP